MTTKSKRRNGYHNRDGAPAIAGLRARRLALAARVAAGQLELVELHDLVEGQLIEALEARHGEALR